ncbi:MAG: hypothetical protein VB042_08665 [Victivallaceae bacterium]|nr:hypothetical protein [Victivallaceae bacterium]
MTSNEVKIAVLNRALFRSNCTAHDVKRSEEKGYLTEELYGGLPVYWYCDDDGFQAAAYADSGEFLSDEDIENLSE